MAWTPIKLRKGGDVTFVGEAEGAGGGSQPGAARVLGPFTFAYDAVGLADGIEFYTPTPGDLLLDGVVFIGANDSFDGTTPLADFGYASDAGGGLLNASVGPLSVAVPWDPSADSAALRPPSGKIARMSDGGPANGYSSAPYLFVTAQPLSAWVSQDGLPGGDPVGSTGGLLTVYLVVASPAAS